MLVKKEDEAMLLIACPGEVLYWDLVDGNVARKFRAHPGVVCSLAMHPQGTHLLTSALDGVVKVWAAEPHAPAVAAQAVDDMYPAF